MCQPATSDTAPVKEDNTAATTTDGAAVPSQTPAVESKDATSPLQVLWAETQSHAHHEIWGVNLSDPATHVPSQIILQKYLNANDGDLEKAKKQLKDTLDFRAKQTPIALLQKYFSKDKFAGLGYVTSYGGETATPDTKEVFTWNVYGSAKDIQHSFGDLDVFLEWRVALMEMAMQELDLSSATKPITSEQDPYKIYQVHDYKSISFLRSPPAVRSAARKTVEVLAMAYPETLKEKFFVNVPGKSILIYQPSL